MPRKETGQSAYHTTSEQISARHQRAMLLAYSFHVGTATQGSVIFRDGGSGGAVRWAESNIAVTASGDVTKTFAFPKPIIFEDDIYMAITGTNTTVCVEWAPINYGGS